MNKYDPIMFFLVNRLLQPFGLRITEKETVVYLYRLTTPNNTDGKNETSVHIIKLSNDVSDAFTFLHIDYEDYMTKKFENIFDFSTYFVESCPYLTKQFILSLEKGIGSPVGGQDDLTSQLDKFVKYVKLAHINFREFNFVPIIMYPNLKESIVRKFFNSEEVNKQFIDVKLRNLKHVELPNKFSGYLIVEWLHQLKDNSELCGIFAQAFVNFATQRQPQFFPRYLVDNDRNIIKKEVITFYNQVFQHTEAYSLYKLDKLEKEEVVT